MSSSLPFLSILIWLPIIVAFLLLLLNKDISQNFLKLTALFTIGTSLSVCVFLLFHFNYEIATFQWQEVHEWLPVFDMQYALGIDGFSLALISLTTLITFFTILSLNGSNIKYPIQYTASFLIMQGLLCGAFSALDSILFYLFWETILIPMFLMIGVWGGPNRIYAAIKFFLYTFLGSIFLLIAIIYLHHMALRSGINPKNSFLINTFHDLILNLETQKWVFWALLIGFAVKIPMWPLHTWLPDAHVEAPTEGSVILAAILLKLGIYGFLRFLLPIVPDAAQLYAQLMITLSLIAIVYISFVAIAQKDIKKLIAYSSISHMGFATLGCFSFLCVNQSSMLSAGLLGIEGALVQVISHGFISAGLFFSIGILYRRLHTRSIHQYGGIVQKMPVFASFFMLFTLANIALPGTSGFVGEFLVLLSSFQARFIYAILAALTLILSAIYMLRLYKQALWGDIVNKDILLLKDITSRERVILMALSIFIILFGLWPQPILKLIHASSDNLTQHVLRSKLSQS